MVSRGAFEIANRNGDPIRGDVWSMEAAADNAAIVVCHGFKGFKDWGFFPFLSQQLCERTGLPVISFNFSGSGIGPDLEHFTELDRFEANTFSKELDDLGRVLEAALAGSLPNLGSIGRFGLLGHSRGGASAIIHAAEDPRVACLVTWAAVASLDRWTEEQKREWRQTGRIEVLNARTGQMMPLGVGLLEDVEANRERLDPLKAASSLRVPYLIVHGTADESVSVADGEELSAVAPLATSRFAAIEDAGHTFGAVHPFQDPSPHLLRVLELTVEWFQQHMSL